MPPAPDHLRHRRGNAGLLLLLVAVVLSPPFLIAFAFWAANPARVENRSWAAYL
jgi:hypothetical protein